MRWEWRRWLAKLCFPGEFSPLLGPTRLTPTSATAHDPTTLRRRGGLAQRDSATGLPDAAGARDLQLIGQLGHRRLMRHLRDELLVERPEEVNRHLRVEVALRPIEPRFAGFR